MFKKINMWILMGKKVIVVRKNEKITLVDCFGYFMLFQIKDWEEKIRKWWRKHLSIGKKITNSTEKIVFTP